MDSDGQVEWYRYYDVASEPTTKVTGVALADGGALLAASVNGSHVLMFRVGSSGELASGCSGVDPAVFVPRSATQFPLAHMPVSVATVSESVETLTTTPQHMMMETALQCGDPCALPMPYCESSPNSVGPGAAIAWGGSTSLAANDLLLTVTALPPSTPGVFFCGTQPTELPFQDGTLCVAPPSWRFGTVTSFVTGDAALAFDLTDMPCGAPAMVAGSRWFLQLWYRDPMGGPAGTNQSNGLDVTICP